MQPQATTTTTTGRAWALWRAGMQEYISAHYMFSSQAFTEVANCGIMHYNSPRAGPGLVNCGGSCSRLFLLHPSSNFLLVQMFAPCGCAVSTCENIYILNPYFHMCGYSLSL